jgi:hypothetical protein
MRLTIQTNEGTQTVIAKPFGPYLAVHRRPDYNQELHADLWTLSHVPTGMRLLKDLTQEDAVSIAKDLLSLDWNFTGEVMPPGTADAALKIVGGYKPALSTASPTG